MILVMLLLLDDDRLEATLDRVMETRLHQLEIDIVKELNTVFGSEIEQHKCCPFYVEQENKTLTERVSKLEQAQESQYDAKVHAILNDQYARRSLIWSSTACRSNTMRYQLTELCRQSRTILKLNLKPLIWMLYTAWAKK